MDGFSIDMGAVATVVGNMRSATLKIEDTTNTLEAESQARLSAWEGAAQERYWVCKAQWESAIRDMSAVLNNANISLDTINQNHASAERSNVNLW